MTSLPYSSDTLAASRTSLRALALARAPWIAALLALGVLLTTGSSHSSVGVFYDDGIYLDLARALISGSGYRHLALPGTPAGVHYPPLFPAWLASWSWLRSLFGPHDVVAWLKLGNVLLTTVAVALWTSWGVRRLSLHPAVAGAITAVSLLIVPARAVTSVLFSEPLSWVLLAAALLFVPDESESDPRRWIAGVAAAALLPMARSILLPLAIAAAWQLVRTRRLSIAWRAAFIALTLAPMVAWSLWTASHGAEIPPGWQANYGSYTGMWLASWSSPGDLIALAWRQLGGIVRITTAIWSAPGAAVAALCMALGAGVLCRSQRWVLLGSLGYVALVLVWPIEPDRFVWGVLPLVALLGAAGAAEIVRRLHARRLAVILVLLVVALPAGACTRWTVAGYRHRGWIVPQEIAERNAAPLVRWGRTLPADQAVLTGNDPLFAMATGRRAAPALPPDLGEARGQPRSTPAERLEQSACALGAGWIAIGDSADQVGAALRQLLASRASRLHVMERVALDGRGEAWRFVCR